MDESGEVLFRDYGLSGIVIFNVSAYIARNIAKQIKAKYYLSLDLFAELTQKQLEDNTSRIIVTTIQKLDIW